MKIENEISYLKRSANFNTVNHLERGIFENVYNCVLNFEYFLFVSSLLFGFIGQRKKNIDNRIKED